MITRGPMPRSGGLVDPTKPWPVWRIGWLSAPEDDLERWVALAPGDPLKVFDDDGYFPTHAEALAYALEQSGANRLRLPEVCS